MEFLLLYYFGGPFLSTRFPFSLLQTWLKFQSRCVIAIDLSLEDLNSGTKMQEKMLMEDPVLGKQYQAYMRRVPYRVIPYVW